MYKCAHKSCQWESSNRSDFSRYGNEIYCTILKSDMKTCYDKAIEHAAATKKQL